jgi:hypothetical protein
MFVALPTLTPETIASFFALAFGFSIAGLCASGYRLFMRHFPSFRLLEVGPVPARFAAIPLRLSSSCATRSAAAGSKNAAPKW